MKVEALDCSYRYRHFPKGEQEEYAVYDIRLTILPSKIFGIVGANGAGKSTLAYLLAGLLKPSKGLILADGKNIYTTRESLAAFRKSVALVPQFPEDQFFSSSLYQELSFGLERRGSSRDEIQMRIAATLKLLGLEFDVRSLMGRSPFELGGGERRLISIAAALVAEPKILILDEPTARLDSKASQRIWELICELRQQLRLTIIIISHEMERLVCLVDWLVIMHQGKIVRQGTPLEIFSKPAELKPLGLEWPQITLLGYKLEQFGIKHDHRPIFEPQEAAILISKWFEERR
ncbi:MAG: energy-coupling factor ABC transporter ATP-binding protein [bacterium]|nr:energy-coupling factor ABC transporter ATP-binding protein [bacterium]